VWASVIKPPENSLNVQVRPNKLGMPTIYIQRSQEELLALLRLRLGPLAEYDPYKGDSKTFRAIDKIPGWSCNHAIFRIDKPATGYRMMVTRLLLDRRPHLFMDGTRLLGISLDKDDELSSATQLNNFQSFAQLFVIFGFVETANKLNQALIENVMLKRGHTNQHCWLFLPIGEDPLLKRGMDLSTSLLRHVQSCEVRTPKSDTNSPPPPGGGGCLPNDRNNVTARKGGS
jgi:hypothetical protein